MVTLAPPAVDGPCRAGERQRAVVASRLDEVALVPDDLVARLHRAAPQAVRLRARGERDIEADWYVLAGVDVQLDAPERLGDVDPDRAGRHRVRIAVVGTFVVGERRHAVDAAELQRIHHPAGRVV